MRSIFFLVVFLAAVIFVGSRFSPLGQVLNFPKNIRDVGQKPSTKPSIMTNIPKDCNGKITPTMIDGPYYKAGSPVKTVLRESSTVGERFTLTGYVFDTNCNPVEGSWIDFWQADGSGSYDNNGYKLRGHQFTDSAGRYYLETVIPGEYTTRTAHIHVKVRAREASSTVTTQLYFPAQTRNAQDPIFDSATLIKVESGKEGKTGTYNFVVEVNQ